MSMPWMNEKPLPDARMGLAAATCDAPPPASGEWVYAVGGSGANLTYGLVEGYDTVQETWTTITTMPTPRNGIGAASSPGRLHALAGWQSAATPVTTHEVYEPANDAWSQAAPLPTARGALAAVTGPDGLIYAIGGFDGTNGLATVEAYDVATDKWITKAPLHTPRMWVAAVVGHDGQIYAIGGSSKPGVILDSVEVFNVATNTWTPSPHAMPTGTCALAAAVDPNGLIYAIGGNYVASNKPVVSPNVYSYDPAAPGWTAQPSLSSGRGGLAADTGPDGLIYAIGGSDGTNPVATVEAYTTDKCYPIEHQIAVLENEISNELSDIPGLPPAQRIAIEKQIAGLRTKLKNLQAQLKTCRGG
jgi:N-acetylneuraminic acid mutarotase